MKKIFLFPILLILIALLSCDVKAQQEKNVYKSQLENEVWITDKILGLDPSLLKYNLKKSINQGGFTGNLTSFTNKINYKSKNEALCGNDNFTIVNGKYEFFDKNKIKISVDSITYHGEWEKPTEYRAPNNLIYLISKIGDKIILTKQEEE